MKTLLIWIALSLSINFFPSVPPATASAGQQVSALDASNDIAAELAALLREHPDEKFGVEIGGQRVPEISVARAGWDDCYSNSPETNLIYTFKLKEPGYVPANTYFRCGVSGPAGWGYRHILSEHGSQWAALGALLGSDWTEMAHFGISATLIAPERVEVGNNKKTFYTPIEIYSGQGVLMKEYNIRVTRGANNGNIITSFYSR